MTDWSHVEGWPTAGAWQAIWTFVGVLVAGSAALVALRQLRAHHKAQLDQARPYVIVDFVFRSMLLMIEIKNIGQSPAEGIKLDWSPVPKTTDAKRSDVLKRNIVDGKIPFLAPGRSIKYAVDPAPKFLKAPDLPKWFEVVASYSDGRGNEFFGERYVLDLDQWAESLVDSDYDSKNWNEFKRQTEAQKKISDHLARIDDRAEGLLASFAQTAVQMLAASRVGRSDGVVWAVIPHSLEGRLVANVGCEVARGVEIAEIGDGCGSDFLQIEGDDLPRDVRVGDAVELSLFPGFGQPSSAQIRVTWTESGRQSQAEYTVGLGR